MKLNYLIYSNLDSKGRHFRASSFEKYAPIENEIEKILGSIGDPDKLNKIEWLFCRLPSRNYLYVRFFPKGAESNSGRRAQIYQCIVLSEKDFVGLDRLPCLLNNVTPWRETIPEEYRQNPISIDKEIKIDIDSIVETVKIVDRDLFHGVLYSFTMKKKALRLPLRKNDVKLLEAAFACTPYIYRNNISYTSYYNSVASAPPPFAVVIDHSLNSTAGKNHRFEKQKIPFEKELSGFLDHPDKSSYDRLFSWTPSKKPRIRTGNAPPPPKKRPMRDEPSPGFRPRGMPFSLSRLKWIAAAIGFVFFLFLFFFYLPARGEYGRFKSKIHLLETEKDPEKIYDAYVKFDSNNRLARFFFSYEHKIEDYRKKSHQYVFGKIRGAESCEERVRLSKAYLKKFPKTPRKRETRALMAVDNECAAWKKIESEIQNLLIQRKYEQLIENLTSFIEMSKTPEFKEKATSQKKGVIDIWDCYEYKRIETSCRKHSFQQARGLAVEYLQSGLFNRFRESVDTCIKWIDDHSQEKKFTIEVSASWDSNANDVGIFTLFEKVFSNNGEQIKVVLEAGDHKSKEAPISPSGNSGEETESVHIQWALNMPIAITVYDKGNEEIGKSVLKKGLFQLNNTFIRHEFPGSEIEKRIRLNFRVTDFKKLSFEACKVR